jgi:hypothetical protein
MNKRGSIIRNFLVWIWRTDGEVYWARVPTKYVWMRLEKGLWLLRQNIISSHSPPMVIKEDAITLIHQAWSNEISEVRQNFSKVALTYSSVTRAWKGAQRECGCTLFRFVDGAHPSSRSGNILVRWSPGLYLYVLQSLPSIRQKIWKLLPRFILPIWYTRIALCLWNYFIERFLSNLVSVSKSYNRTWVYVYIFRIKQILLYFHFIIHRDLIFIIYFANIEGEIMSPKWAVFMFARCNWKRG